MKTFELRDCSTDKPMGMLLGVVVGSMAALALALFILLKLPSEWVDSSADELKAIRIGESKTEIMQRLGPPFVHVPAKVSSVAHAVNEQEFRVGEAHVVYRQRDSFGFRTRIDLWFEADLLRSVHVKRRLIGGFEYMDGPIYSLGEFGAFVGEDFERVFRNAE